MYGWFCPRSAAAASGNSAAASASAACNNVCCDCENSEADLDAAWGSQAPVESVAD